MQKIKNEKGITMIALVITVIVLALLAGISLNKGMNSLKETADNIIQAELGIVQQAIISEYGKAKQLGYTTKSEIPPNFAGTNIAITDLPNNVNWKITEEPTEKYKAYYELNKEDLEDLKIFDSEYTYIVNYYTGEVYNKTLENEEIYIYAINIDSQEKQADTESFTDWDDM